MSNTSDIIEEVRIFFKKIKWKNILTFSFFVLLSAIFWLMQIYRQKFETTISIPIHYTNIPDSVVFDSRLPDVLNVRIKEDGANLFRYHLTKRNDTLNIDIRDKIGKYESSNLEGQALESIIRGKLLSSSELIGYYPPQISYAYKVLHLKKVPIIYGGHIDLPQGYILDGDLTLSPDSVMAYGSSTSLDTLVYAHTTGDTIANITNNKTIKIAVEPSAGIRFAPDSINLSIPIDAFTSEYVEVPVTCANLPEGLEIKFFPSTVKIPFFVGRKRSRDINIDDFKVIVDYNHISKPEERLSSAIVLIMKSPDYIRTQAPVPAEVEFVLEEKRNNTKSIDD